MLKVVPGENDSNNVTTKTIAARCPLPAARCHYATGLLDAFTAADGSLEWGRLDASVVNGYVAERGRPYSVVSRAHIVDAVRCLLRWALSTGHLDRDLSAGILKPAGTGLRAPVAAHRGDGRAGCGRLLGRSQRAAGARLHRHHDAWNPPCHFHSWLAGWMQRPAAEPSGVG